MTEGKKGPKSGDAEGISSLRPASAKQISSDCWHSWLPGRFARLGRPARACAAALSLRDYEALKANATALTKEVSSNGLLKNAIAPAFNARS